MVPLTLLLMNKTITLSKEQWHTVIEGLSYALEQAQEVSAICEEAEEDVDRYNDMINLIAEKLAK